MPLPTPHHLALFSLVAINERAREVLADPKNRDLVSYIPGFVDEDDPCQTLQGINVGLHINTRSEHILARVGRSGTDIVIEGADIANLQCEFQIDPDSQVCLICDVSEDQTMEVYRPGSSLMSGWESIRPNRVALIARGFQTVIAFGSRSNPAYFRIHWHPVRFNLTEKLLLRRPRSGRRKATLDSHIQSIADPRTLDLFNYGEGRALRYVQGPLSGKGAFGSVYAAVNEDTGQLMAVKEVKLTGTNNATRITEFIQVKREIQALADLSHPNILEIFAVQWNRQTTVKIFTALKDGSAHDLTYREVFTTDSTVLVSFIHQILKALDFIASRNIIHRDVKPANILYKLTRDRRYIFQLGDFGLCNTTFNARMVAGTTHFMAPELATQGGVVARQTPKMDVFSFFVTIAYVLNENGLRAEVKEGWNARIRKIQEASRGRTLRPFMEMAIINPDERASAADMLDKLFDGEGRTTPRHGKD
ncbi:hypothetical protein VTO42DRAFT_160 [Malbranchea cinnamomea]